MYTAYLHGFNIEAPMDVLGIIITPLKSLPPHSLSRPIRGRGREWINRAFILVPVDPPPTSKIVGYGTNHLFFFTYLSYFNNSIHYKIQYKKKSLNFSENFLSSLLIFPSNPL